MSVAGANAGPSYGRQALPQEQKSTAKKQGNTSGAAVDAGSEAGDIAQSRESNKGGSIIASMANPASSGAMGDIYIASLMSIFFGEGVALSDMPYETSPRHMEALLNKGLSEADPSVRQSFVNSFAQRANASDELNTAIFSMKNNLTKSDKSSVNARNANKNASTNTLPERNSIVKRYQSLIGKFSSDTSNTGTLQENTPMSQSQQKTMYQANKGATKQGVNTNAKETTETLKQNIYTLLKGSAKNVKTLLKNMRSLNPNFLKKLEKKASNLLLNSLNKDAENKKESQKKASTIAASLAQSELIKKKKKAKDDDDKAIDEMQSELDVDGKEAITSVHEQSNQGQGQGQNQEQEQQDTQGQKNKTKSVSSKRQVSADSDLSYLSDAKEASSTFASINTASVIDTFGTSMSTTDVMLVISILMIQMAALLAKELGALMAQFKTQNESIHDLNGIVATLGNATAGYRDSQGWEAGHLENGYKGKTFTVDIQNTGLLKQHTAWNNPLNILQALELYGIIGSIPSDDTEIPISTLKQYMDDARSSLDAVNSTSQVQMFNLQDINNKRSSAYDAGSSLIKKWSELQGQMIQNF